LIALSTTTLTDKRMNRLLPSRKKLNNFNRVGIRQWRDRNAAIAWRNRLLRA
jgi:hypothetical protein